MQDRALPPIWHGRSFRWRLIFVAIPLLAFVSYLPVVGEGWEQARGYEYEWVAWSLAQGHGYSFDGGTAWLGPYGPISEYSPTAWIEPIQTGIMALCFRSFGEQGRMLLVLLNAVWLALTVAIISLIVDDLTGAVPAAFAAIMYAALPMYEYGMLLYIGNGALTAFLVSAITLLLMRVIRRPSLPACSALGVGLGLSALVHAATLFAIPLVVAAVIFTSGFWHRSAWRCAGVVALCAVVVTAPWTVRNLVVFGELVPVRTGGGFNSYIGNPGLARTIEPRLREGDAQSTPLWRAADSRDALWKLKNIEVDRALRWYSLERVRESAPDGYSEFNEAQRDQVFRDHAKSFIHKEFPLAVTMGIWKVIAFFGFWAWPFRVTTLMAFLGLVLRLRDPKCIAVGLVLAAYTLPYAIALPLYLRYRFPVEPLLIVLSGVLLGTMIDVIRRYLPDFRGRLS